MSRLLTIVLFLDNRSHEKLVGSIELSFMAYQPSRRCPWCNGYRRRKWTRQHEFKSWTRLIAFHITQIPLGKVWIQLFSLQLWVNSRTDSFFSLGEATSQGEGKLWKPVKLRFRKLTLCHILPERRGWVNMISTF